MCSLLPDPLRQVFPLIDTYPAVIYRDKCELNSVMGRERKISAAARQEELITSLIGLAAILVATAIWWSLAPQWLTSTWQVL